MRNTGKLQQRKPEEQDEGSWAISYGDMVTLLLAFFMLFFSIDSQDLAKEKLTRSLLATLAPVPADPGVLYDQTSKDQTIQDTLTKLEHTKVERIGEKIIVEFPGLSFFKSGDTDINEKGKEALQDFTNKYLPYAGMHILSVVGTTDGRPVSKGRRYRDNLELSVLRAISGQRFLSKAGIPMAQTRLGGYGVKKMPVDDAKLDKDQNALSRSIVLVIEPLGGVQ